MVRRAVLFYGIPSKAIDEKGERVLSFLPGGKKERTKGEEERESESSAENPS